MGKVFRTDRLIVILSEAKNLSVEKPNQGEILRRPAKIAGPQNARFAPQNDKSENLAAT